MNLSADTMPSTKGSDQVYFIFMIKTRWRDEKLKSFKAVQLALMFLLTRHEHYKSEINIKIGYLPNCESRSSYL